MFMPVDRIRCRVYNLVTSRFFNFPKGQLLQLGAACVQLAPKKPAESYKASFSPKNGEMRKQLGAARRSLCRLRGQNADPWSSHAHHDAVLFLTRTKNFILCKHFHIFCGRSATYNDAKLKQGGFETATFKKRISETSPREAGRNRRPTGPGPACECRARDDRGGSRDRARRA